MFLPAAVVIFATVTLTNSEMASVQVGLCIYIHFFINFYKDQVPYVINSFYIFCEQSIAAESFENNLFLLKNRLKHYF